MPYRPYPNADRARRQLDRHRNEAAPAVEPQPLTPLTLQMMRNAQAIYKAAQPTVALAAARWHAAFQPRRSGGGATGVPAP